MSTDLERPDGHVPLQRFALNGPTMGTRYSVIFYAPASCDSASIQTQLQAAVDDVDAQMSPWIPKSDLLRLNQTPVSTWCDLPYEILTVLDCAMRISDASSGAFNACVAAPVDAWGFGARGREPEPGLIARVAGNVPGMHSALEYDLDQGRARRLCDTRFDLCGIAKGFGVDELADVLLDADVENFLISVDGEIRTSGRKPDDTPWIVAIERPEIGTRDVARLLECADLAIATSGTYRHRVRYAGMDHAHTIDPKTGAPLENRLTSVSVLSDECMTADAWATALMVMGENEGPDFARRHGLSALFFTGEGPRAVATGTGMLAS